MQKRKVLNKNLKRARTLRKNQTPTERIIWQRLRNRQIAGCKFRRQHAVNNFIVDFYCEEIKLIIEIDGDVHGYKKQELGDKIRQEILIKMGFNVVHYANNDVYANTENVLEDILRVCERFKNALS